MNLNDLESDERAELAKLYVAHLGETTYCRDDIEFSPTRAFMAYVQEPCDPGYSFLTDEELLSPLQVTLHRGDDAQALLADLCSAVRILRGDFTGVCRYHKGPCDPNWSEGYALTRAVLDRIENTGSVREPYYTADPAFLDWLEDEKRGWPVLKAFLTYFEPDWYLDYLNELAEADEDRERMHRADAHASMLGVTGVYGDRRAE